MKRSILLLSLALALPAFAGTSAKQEIAPAPAPEPSIWQWFAGASAGYLLDNEEAFYSAHVGVDTPWNVAGANVALFLEVGYTEPDQSIDFIRQTQFDVENEIIPVTLNVKFEKAFTDKFGAYLGAGAGVAFVDTKVKAFGDSASDDDTVFTGQVFAGVVYNVTPSFEVFGGARWIYFDDADVFGAEGEALGLGDLGGSDALLEAGIRYNF